MKTIRKPWVMTLPLLLTVLSIQSQTNNYFGSSGILSGSVWSTNISGPYNSPLVVTGGAFLNFNNAATATGATVAGVSGINFNAPVTWTAGGTLGASGTNLQLFVAGGIEHDFGTGQSFSSAVTAAVTKNGPGTLAMSGGVYGGGFTLNEGTVIVRGVNAMGNGLLTLNGGTVASNASRDLSGRYSNIVVGGDIQFGDQSGLSSATASVSFNSNISLGNSLRSFILGNGGVIKFGGKISGTAGIRFTNNVNGTGVIDITNPANSFTGPVSINGGLVRFAADGSFGDPSNKIMLDGGQLVANTSYTVSHEMQVGVSTGTGIKVESPSTLIIDGAISSNGLPGVLNKYGQGVLVLSNAGSFTGTITLSADGGILQLNKTGGNTVAATSNIVVNGGVVRVSSNQTLNGLTLANGSLTVDDGIILTINGSLDYFQPASIVLNGSGKINYGSGATLKYSGEVATIATASEWPAIDGPLHVIVDNAGGVTLPGSMGTRVIRGSLTLTRGMFIVGANVLLGLNGAALNNGGGFLAGSSVNGSGSDLLIDGEAPGPVIIPANGNIGFRNITVEGSRVLSLDGTHDLHLSGTLYIGARATFDNGGECQIIDDGGMIVSDGTFITRDAQGFYGSNSSIPSIKTILNPGCTIEYGLDNGSSQTVTSSASLGQPYYNISFTGSGIKTPANAINVNENGLVRVSGAGTIVNAISNNIGPPGPNNTRLIMDNGRLILGTGGTQPLMDGDYTITGGVIEFAGDANQSVRSKSYQHIEISGANVGNSNGNINLNDQGTFVVKSGGGFTINDNTIQGTGTQTVIVENAGVFRSGNNEGFHGYAATFSNNSSLHESIEQVVLEPGSTVEYMKAGGFPDQNITKTVAYHHLVLSGSGNKRAPPGVLTIHGDLRGTGLSNFEHNNGHVLFVNDSANQYISSTGSNAISFYDLTAGSSFGTGLNINSPIEVNNMLALTDNAKLTLGAGDITLVSNAAATARFGAIPASASISYPGTGRFVVQRYFPPRRAWRLVTSPLSNTGSIYNNWQNGGNYQPGAGVLVSGPGASPLNGLDPTEHNNISMRSGTSMSPVLNTKLTNLSGASGAADNIGYFLFVRGDRDPANSMVPNTNATTISSRGFLQTGDQHFPASEIYNGFTLIGNPYASPVDFRRLTRSNLANRFICWDQGINTVGGWVIADDPDNDGVYSYSVLGPGGQDTHIQPGQAFFVQTSANGTASLTFTEASKSAANNEAVFRPEPGVASKQELRINLHVKNSSGYPADGALAEFYSWASAGIDQADAFKYNNIAESIGLRRGFNSLAIERRPLPNANDTLFLELKGTKQRAYAFEFIPAGLDSLQAVFEDSYTHETKPLNLIASSRYEFSINDDPASSDSGRFSIVFSVPATGLNEDNQSIRVFPNPVSGNTFHLHFKNIPTGVYRFRLIDPMGRLKISRLINHAGNNAIETVYLAQGLARGIYHVEIAGIHMQARKIEVEFQ